MAIDSIFEQALASSNRVGELRKIAQEMLDGGAQPEVVLKRFEQIRASLRESGREDDEDTIMDVMDMISGWCSPHMTLRQK